MSDELKPCPNRKCKSTNVCISVDEVRGTSICNVCVLCNNCLMQGPPAFSGERTKAIIAWNEDLPRAEPIANTQRVREAAGVE